MKNFILSLSLISILVLGGCSSEQKVENAASPEDAASSEIIEANGEDISSITIAVEGFAYSPSSVTIQEGTELHLTFINNGSAVHDLVIDELDVSTELLNPGETETLIIPDIEAGTYTYYCSVANHREMGLEGLLKVQ